MRYGIYGLAGLVRNELGFDPSSGDVFVFLVAVISLFIISMYLAGLVVVIIPVDVMTFFFVNLKLPNPMDLFKLYAIIVLRISFEYYQTFLL